MNQAIPTCFIRCLVCVMKTMAVNVSRVFVTRNSLYSKTEIEKKRFKEKKDIENTNIAASLALVIIPTSVTT